MTICAPLMVVLRKPLPGNGPRRRHLPQPGLAFGTSGGHKGPDWLQKEAGLLWWKPGGRGRQHPEP
jgi:hypothetical protein